MKTSLLSLIFCLSTIWIAAQEMVRVEPHFHPEKIYLLKKQLKSRISTSHKFSDTLPEELLVSLKEITAGNDKLLFPGDNPDVISLELLIITGQIEKEKGTFPIEVLVLKAESLPVDTVYPTWKISELHNRKVLGNVIPGSKPILDSIDIPDVEQWERNFSLGQLSKYLENEDIPTQTFRMGETIGDTIMPVPEDPLERTQIISYTLENIVDDKAFLSFRKKIILPEEIISNGEQNEEFDDIFYLEYLAYEEFEEGSFIYDIRNNIIEEKKVFSFTEAKILRLSMTTISTAKIQENYTETIKILSPNELQEFGKLAKF